MSQKAVTPRVTIMWSQLNISDCSTFTANHFVYLEPRCRDDNDHRHQFIVSGDDSERSEAVRNDTLGYFHFYHDLHCCRKKTTPGKSALNLLEMKSYDNIDKGTTLPNSKANDDSP